MNFAFLSSLTRDANNTAALKFRRDVYELGTARARPIWVAEHAEPELAVLPQGMILRRLRAAIAESERVFCVLTQRIGADDFGQRIAPAGFADASACSFVEMEMLYAVLLRKPIHLFALENFTPGPRLRAFLDYLRLDLAREQVHVMKSLEDVTIAITALLDQRQRNKIFDRPPTAGPKFFAGLAQMRAGDQAFSEEQNYQLPHYLAERSVLIEANPNLSRVDQMLEAVSTRTRHDEKLELLWLARRELGAWPVNHAGHPKDPELKQRLAKVLSLWAGSAAWSGLHGYTRLGQLEALAELRLLRLPRQSHEGGIVSAYYSTALQMQGKARADMLSAALKHSFVAEIEEPNNPGIRSVRASIYFRQRKFWAARDLYRQVLKEREANADSKLAAVGESEIELAFMEAITLSPRRALHMAQSGLSKLSDDDFKVRGLQKYALILAANGKLLAAREAKLQAEALRLKLGR
jgi:hypothetical protein